MFQSQTETKTPSLLVPWQSAKRHITRVFSRYQEGRYCVPPPPQSTHLPGNLFRYSLVPAMWCPPPMSHSSHEMRAGTGLPFSVRALCEWDTDSYLEV